MQSVIPDCFKDLRWHRLRITLLNIHTTPLMSSHPVSVMQAIINGASTSVWVKVSRSSFSILKTGNTPKGLYLKSEAIKKFLTQFEAEMERKV
ncbi:MAG: hypothetical protein AABZ11_02605, partial [Nitrospinota bacterium]